MRRWIGTGLALALASCGSSSLPDGATTTSLSADSTGTPTRSVTLSWSDTCAVTRLGAARCWGDNYFGQLGTGDHQDSHVPAAVQGLGSDVAKMAIGGSHACALTIHGAVKCWGLNTNGQLGIGSTATADVPTDVVGLGSGVMAIAAGAGHVCALTTRGLVKCWGANDIGQLGDGTKNASNVPVDVQGLPARVADIATSGSHTCARTLDEAVYCWGNNEHGQLGSGTTEDSAVPVGAVGLGSDVRAISAGLDHTCAILNHEGTVKCWGRNDFGQLGDGTTTDRTVPVDVGGIGAEVTALASGGYHNCVVTVKGGARCWGLDLSGQLGDGAAISSASPPVDVVGLSSPVTAIALGLYHSCALTGSGVLSCWGFNGNGDLAMDTSTESTSVPVTIQP
jgi:alpha-tubulin suppressor-like RCC1 family protein